MAQWNRKSQEQSVEVSGGSDINFSNFSRISQPCSSFSLPQEDAQAVSSVASIDNGNGTNEKKPALPPKPFPGPPTYREPPSPPVSEEISQHPDICINAAPLHRPVEQRHSSEVPYAIERPEKLGARNHAWVQEHKTSGKLVGEKLSSIQRKLRSLLTQSTSKDTEVEKNAVHLEEKSAAEGHDDKWNFQSLNEKSPQKMKCAISGQLNPRSASPGQDNLNYISQSSFGATNTIALTSIHQTNHNHPYRTYIAERHPFGAPINLSEQDDSTDPDQLRDTCSKLFTREQGVSWTNYASPRNSYSNNITSSYDYDKLVPKEVIGRPSHEKKPDLTANAEAIYGGVTPLPSFSKPQKITIKETEVFACQALNGSYFARTVESLEDPSIPDSHSTDAKTTKESDMPSNSLTSGATDCIDMNDIYKSSSESGRGTMHSSIHGSKSVVSPHSSGVSAASNLDTSLDSDHSIGALWEQQQNDNDDDKRFSDYHQVRHIYETPNTTLSCRQTDDAPKCEESSESLSLTPPLPPLSSAPSPSMSTENSPKQSSRAKYKLSLSASALNSSYKHIDSQTKVCEIATSKTTSGKKSGIRRTTSINQASSRHRSNKSYQCSKGLSTLTHRVGISHGSCASKKSLLHPSKNQIVFPLYMDNVDPELTSTTTGLDMESLLDDADDYSSDLSATASTMEPNEVNMIRKQLEGLETMYSEILRLLGVKNMCQDTLMFGGNNFDLCHQSRRRINDSLSSLTARSSASRGTYQLGDKRGLSEKRRTKSDSRLSSASKRLQRLESHVVTLARSVAHLSSEMRTQHVLVQEMENMRQDVRWVQERMRLMQLAQGAQSALSGGRSHQVALPRDWDNVHREVLELLNPCRAKKLTRFFGDEPPLIRQFLKRLGYEKYVSNFENEKIGIKELPYLTEDRLQKMGIPMGPRIRILQEVQTCCQQNQYKVYIV